MHIFLALADPTRRHIVESLALSEQASGEIAAQFDMSKPAVSQHLKILRDSGIVSVRRDGQRRIYALREEGLSEIDRWLRQVRQFWNSRLDRLEDALKEDSNNE